MTDPVERQVEAYNAHDIDGFLACFTDNVVVTGPDGSVQMAGQAEMRAQYEGMFEKKDLHAEIVNRIRAGNWVVDQERVTRPGMSMEVLVAYEIAGPDIVRMIILR